MAEEPANTSAAHTGVASLILLLRFLGIAADQQQLVHRYGKAFGPSSILRCAKELGLKARAVDSGWDRLARTPLPAIAETKDGQFFILGKVSETGALVQDPLAGQP